MSLRIHQKTIFALFGGLFACSTAMANLVGYWPLDGNGEAVVGSEGLLRNNSAAAVDRNGNTDGALVFNGNNQYVEVPGGGGLDGLVTGTVSMWVKWTGSQQEDCCAAVSAVERIALNTARTTSEVRNPCSRDSTTACLGSQ